METRAVHEAAFKKSKVHGTPTLEALSLVRFPFARRVLEVLLAYRRALQLAAT